MAVHAIAMPHLLHAIGFSLYLDRQLRRPRYVLRTAVMYLHCENDRCPSPAPVVLPKLGLYVCHTWLACSIDLGTNVRGPVGFETSPCRDWGLPLCCQQEAINYALCFYLGILLRFFYGFLEIKWGAFECRCLRVRCECCSINIAPFRKVWKWLVYSVLFLSLPY